MAESALMCGEKTRLTVGVQFDGVSLSVERLFVPRHVQEKNIELARVGRQDTRE